MKSDMTRRPAGSRPSVPITDHTVHIDKKDDVEDTESPFQGEDMTYLSSTTGHSGRTAWGIKAWLYPELPWGAPPEWDKTYMRGVIMP